ncbi:alanine dehydrogenase [Nevskia soli]|jgi:alanine dehydrogenase|uniref:alanine dehydrogenase n=1 Tax=Nevskia soli TaxID=418856 RepID=UPI0015D8613B|nr:alanine dehydrogenase [Nevskia soli]
MIIGVPKEVKDHEARVALVPSGVTALREAGHQILVQTKAGAGSALPDEDYAEAGATIVAEAADVWRRADIVVKVKEPQESEYAHLRPGLTLFTYLHLAPLRALTDRLLASQTTGIAYETIVEKDGSLPLLTPMSEVAGRMSAQVGAQYLEAPNGGRGVLLGGVPGVAPANVVILGGGVVGTNAAKIALGMGARVSIIDRNLNRLRELDDIFGGRLRTLASNTWTITETVRHADLVIGAVLIPGASAPRLVRRSMIANMRRGSVVVDVAIDQGGCFETSHPTTHTDPIYFVDGVLHYCVSNMPAAVANTSTLALTNATFPYLMSLANRGVERAIDEQPGLRAGVNTYAGHITYPAVAQSQGRTYRELSDVMGVHA